MIATGQTLLTRKQAAEALGLKPETLAVWASTKRYSLRYLKVGRYVRYRAEDIEAFLNERTVDPGKNGHAAGGML